VCVLGGGGSPTKKKEGNETRKGKKGGGHAHGEDAVALVEHGRAHGEVHALVRVARGGGGELERLLGRVLCGESRLRASVRACVRACVCV
jgi:hypothetical protein